MSVLLEESPHPTTPYTRSGNTQILTSTAWPKARHGCNRDGQKSIHHLLATSLYMHPRVERLPPSGSTAPPLRPRSGRRSVRPSHPSRVCVCVCVCTHQRGGVWAGHNARSGGGPPEAGTACDRTMAACARSLAQCLCHTYRGGLERMRGQGCGCVILSDDARMAGERCQGVAGAGWGRRGERNEREKRRATRDVG